MLVNVADIGRLAVEHLPGQREAEPLWLWSSMAGADAAPVPRCWQIYLRRFDLGAHLPPVQANPGFDAPKELLPSGGNRWT